MSRRNPDHPAEALASPDVFYERSFKNYPHPWLVKLVGNGAMRLAKPHFSYYGGVSAEEYFSSIPKGPLALTFTHRGLEKLHDPIAAAAAVFGTPALIERVEDTNVWAASPYMNHPIFGPIIRRLGGISVNRGNDYEKFGLSPTDDEKNAVTEALVGRSAGRQIASPRSVLGSFPAGTKGGTILREGIGMVMALTEVTTALPIALVSKTEETSNIPKGLEIAFGEPVPPQPGQPAGVYMEAIAASLDAAVDSVTLRGAA